MESGRRTEECIAFNRELFPFLYLDHYYYSSKHPSSNITYHTVFPSYYYFVRPFFSSCFWLGHSFLTISTHGHNTPTTTNLPFFFFFFFFTPHYYVLYLNNQFLPPPSLLQFSLFPTYFHSLCTRPTLLPSHFYFFYTYICTRLCMYMYQFTSCSVHKEKNASASQVFITPKTGFT